MRPRCPFVGLAMWTDGDGIFIAKTAAEARAIALDPIPDDMLAECDVPIESWSRVAEDPLVLFDKGAPIEWSQHAWIIMNGPCFLALAGGELTTGRRSV